MPTTLHLLILEDSLYDAELEVATLEEAGYLCRWERVETQTEFLAHLDVPDYVSRSNRARPYRLTGSSRR